MDPVLRRFLRAVIFGVALALLLSPRVRHVALVVIAGGLTHAALPTVRRALLPARRDLARRPR